MYQVVEFCDNGVGVIRREWWTPQKKRSVWPPYKAWKKVNKCLMNIIPPDENWTIHPVKRVLYETDDLDKANTNCKRAETESELASSEEGEPAKRRKKRTHVYDSSDTENEEDKYNFKFPKPPADQIQREGRAPAILQQQKASRVGSPSSNRHFEGPRTNNSPGQSQQPRDLIYGEHRPGSPSSNRHFEGPRTNNSPGQSQQPRDLIYGEHRPGSPSSNRHFEGPRTNNSPGQLQQLRDFTYGSPSRNRHFEGLKTSGSDELQNLRDFTIDSPVSSNPRSRTPSSIQETKPSLLEQINASLASIAKHIGDIKSDISELKTVQTVILTRIPTTTPIEDKLPEHITLPLNSFDDVEKIENWIQDEANKENLIRNLSFIGGNKVPSVIRRILERVFSNTLAVQCNWTGKNEKRELRHLGLINVITDAVRRNNVAQNAQDMEIKDVVASWFRFAKDRDGGRDRRRRTN